jgi:hypothetical protein
VGDPAKVTLMGYPVPLQLAQRIPVRVNMDHMPQDALVVAGQTAKLEIRLEALRVGLLCHVVPLLLVVLAALVLVGVASLRLVASLRPYNTSLATPVGATS